MGVRVDADTAAPSNVVAPAKRRARGIVSSLSELAKARLSSLVVATTAVGFWVAAARPVDLALFVWALAGTTLSAFGANTLNQWWERERDARMHRTRWRPIPAGDVTPRFALAAGLAECLLGVGVLALFVNVLTAGLSLACIALYVLIYTPLKPRSSINTHVGAVCGAIPPMMGWSAATGALEPGAFILGAVLFAWQIPHFLSLAWLYREDYERGGYRMLPSEDPSGRTTAAMVCLYSVALIPIALMGAAGGLAGPVYAAGAVALGGMLTYLGARLVARRESTQARRVFLASLIYLPLLLGIMVADAKPSVAVDSGVDVSAPAIEAASPSSVTRSSKATQPLGVR
jgi:protoheme IX farnesyltransferase